MGGAAATEQETEHRILLKRAKETFAKQVAKRVRPQSRGISAEYSRNFGLTEEEIDIWGLGRIEA